MRIPVGSALALIILLAAPAALSDPPPHAGGGKARGGPPAHAGGPSKTHGAEAHRKGGGAHREVYRGGGAEITVRFHDRDYVVIRDWYDDMRHCPPGLAKKHNGCLPPGQARKWRIGRVLPPDVIYYDLPPELVVRLSPLSPGYKYVRVGADILKIAVGTGLIVDAIHDLGRL